MLNKHLTCTGKCKFPALTSILLDAVKEFSQNTNIYMITKKYKSVQQTADIHFSEPLFLQRAPTDIVAQTLLWFTHQTEANILSHDTQFEATFYAMLFHPVFMLSAFITALSVSIYYFKMIWEIFSNLACFWEVFVSLTKENCLLFGDPVREGGSDQWSSAKKSDQEKHKKQWGFKSISESEVIVLKSC